MVALTTIRTAAYGVFTLFGLLTFVLAAAFVGSTATDYGFYWEAAAELIAAGILSLLTLVPLHFFVHRRGVVSVLSSLMVEVAVVAVIWLLYLGGAAAFVAALPNLTSSFCDLSLCKTAQALQAFSWLACITLTFILALLLYVASTETSKKDSSIWKAPFEVTEGGVKKEEQGVQHAEMAVV